MEATTKPDVTSLDEDLTELRRGKFSAKDIDTIKSWVFDSILREKIDSSKPLLELLKDGTVLCRLANTLYSADNPTEPTFIKWKQSKMPFVQMEQIAQFISFARNYGVPEDELFQTVDLYEEKDPASVYLALKSLSRCANKRHPELFPVLGPQLATKRPRPPVKQKPKHLQGDMGWSTIEYGYMKGASQKTEHIVFGQKRDIVRRE